MPQERSRSSVEARGAWRPFAALGLALARSGPLAVLALVLAGLTTLGALAATVAVAERGATAPWAELSSVVSSALAWGAGLLLVYAGTARVLRKDREEGILALVIARGGTRRSYLLARAVGVAVTVGIVVVGGTFLTGLVSTTLASRAALGRAAQGAVASAVYGLGFAATLTPIGLATLGARARGGGYAWLILVLLVPELLIGWTSHVLPPGWGELASIPRALAGLRAALMPPRIDVAMLVRSLFVLAAVVGFALAIALHQAKRIDTENGA